MNWQTAVILGVLVLIVAAIIFGIVKGKKKGKSSCGCGCANCALKDKCHPQVKK